MPGAAPLCGCGGLQLTPRGDDPTEFTPRNRSTVGDPPSALFSFTDQSWG
jgi:hypothetical protein